MDDHFSADDITKAVKIELNAKELEYLEKLLNCEVVYQIRIALDSVGSNSEKVIKLLSIFEAFRMLDDQVLDFIFTLNQYHKQTKDLDDDYKDIIVVGKSIARLYKTLTTETIKGKLPPEIDVMRDKYNDAINNKIDYALRHSFDVNELKQGLVKTTPVKSKKVKEVKQEKMDLGGLSINIFGKFKPQA